MTKPTKHDIDKQLEAARRLWGGTLPELDAIAWDAYIISLVGEPGMLSAQDYRDIRHPLPDINDNPVDAILEGTHYWLEKEDETDDDDDDDDDDKDDSNFYVESRLERHKREILADTKHFGGHLPDRFAVAWAGMLYGLYRWSLISEAEYQELSDLLPNIENNPVERIERCVEDPQRLGPN